MSAAGRGNRIVLSLPKKKKRRTIDESDEDSNCCGGVLAADDHNHSSDDDEGKKDKQYKEEEEGKQPRKAYKNSSSSFLEDDEKVSKPVAVVISPPKATKDEYNSDIIAVENENGNHRNREEQGVPYFLRVVLLIMGMMLEDGETEMTRIILHYLHYQRPLFREAHIT